MSNPLFPAVASPKPVFGVVHLRALPGAPQYDGDMEAIRRDALADAGHLVEGGVHGLVVENFGDAPFYPGPAPTETIAHMTALAGEIRDRFQVPLGINVLRNDGCGALSVAQAVGAEFIRVNVLGFARLTDQGIIQAIAHDVMRKRTALGADHVRVFADVQVKHSVAMAEVPLASEVDDLLHRCLADALIVTGDATGKPSNMATVQKVRRAAGKAPVWAGSGVDPKNLDAFWPVVDGFIVGTFFKHGGATENRVDPARVQRFVRRYQELLKAKER